MGDTSIEWKHTWNPVRGCKMVSPGCANCCAMRMAGRFSGKGQPYHGLVQLGSKGKGFRWTGDFRKVPELLDAPLRRKKPTTFFVSSMSDLFGEGVSDEYIAAVFGVMAACPQHTFQVLTKRADRMGEFFKWLGRGEGEEHLWCWTYSTDLLTIETMGVGYPLRREWQWPLPNVWLGVSVESQEYADERIPHLLRTPAAVRFLSMEPLLGPVDLSRYLEPTEANPCINCGWEGARCIDNDAFRWSERGDLMCPECGYTCGASAAEDGIGWVILGGESGPKARPMHPDWARSIRDQCQAAGIPYFHKHNGAWVPADVVRSNPLMFVHPNGESSADPWTLDPDGDGVIGMHFVGKKAAGRMLDGRTWDEMPEVRR